MMMEVQQQPCTVGSDVMSESRRRSPRATKADTVTHAALVQMHVRVQLWERKCCHWLVRDGGESSHTMSRPWIDVCEPKPVVQASLTWKPEIRKIRLEEKTRRCEGASTKATGFDTPNRSNT